mmetsp:Transcript_13389/g.36924  ORF Transcript_13389/g.36924 Transcript_13389/m.36924 type:complete len:206 (-) Transcript_13389:99-716(-)
MVLPIDDREEPTLQSEFDGVDEDDLYERYLQNPAAVEIGNLALLHDDPDGSSLPPTLEHEDDFSMDSFCNNSFTGKDDKIFKKPKRHPGGPEQRLEQLGTEQRQVTPRGLVKPCSERRQIARHDSMDRRKGRGKHNKSTSTRRNSSSGEMPMVTPPPLLLSAKAAAAIPVALQKKTSSDTDDVATSTRRLPAQVVKRRVSVGRAA